jgi:predicted nucleic acid-binding protein
VIAICNTSPISNLIQIDALPLLGRLFTQITIPPEVAEELEAGAEVFGAWREALGAAAIEVLPVANTDLVSELSTTLHAGESAAIALALQVGGSVLIIDEADGRKAATHLGLKIVGTVGILLRAKEQQLIERVEPYLQALRTKAHFWLSDGLYNHALVLAGEMNR